MIVQTDAIGITSTFMLGELTVDANQNTVSRGPTSFSVEPRLMRVIVKLAQKAGNVVGRADLLSEISDHAYVSDESLTQAISKIRQIFGDTSRQPKFIKTIPRKGYVLLVQPKLAQPSAVKTEKSENWLSKATTRQLIILVLVALTAAALAIWWVGDTEFVEQGEVEFIEKE